MDLEESYKSLFELLWYSQLPCFDVLNITSEKDDYGKLTAIILSPKSINYVIYFSYDQEVHLERSESELLSHILNVPHKPWYVLHIQQAKSR